MHEVIAAITTWPWSSSVSVPSSSVTGDAMLDARSATCDAAGAAAGGSALVARASRRRCAPGGSEAGKDSSLVLVGLGRPLGSSVVGQHVLERQPERRLGLGQRDAVLRALRAGQRRHDLAEVELERLGVRRLLGVRVVPQALLARRRPRRARCCSFGAAGELEVAQRLRVDREDRAGRAELRATCCRSSPGRPAAGSAMPGP